MTIRDIAVAFGYEVDKNSERKAESSINGMKNMASKALGALKVVLSVAGISELAQAAADVEALKSQFTQVFGDLEKEADDKLNKIAEETGVMAMRMKGSFTQIAAFAKTTGADQATALEISERAMKAVTDSAAFYDRSIEDVTQSMRSFLKGNFEQDAALGLSATETTRNAAANELYGKSFKDLSEQQKQFTLLKMVEDANKTSGAIGQAARESDTWTNQLGNLKQSLKDLKAAAGAGILKPAVAVLKVLISLVNKVTVALQKATSETGIITRYTEKLQAVFQRLKPTIDRTLQSFSKSIQGVVTKLGGLENVVRLIAVAIASLAFVKLISSVKSILSIVSTLNIKLLAIIAIIVLIGLVVEDFIHFMKGNDSIFGKVFDKLGINAEDVRTKVTNAWKKTKEFLSETWDGLKEAGGMLVDTLKGFFNDHGEEIESMWKDRWNTIATFLKGVWTFISQVATTLFGGTEKNIDGSQKTTKEKMLGTWKNILGELRNVLDAIFEAFKAVFDAIMKVVNFVFKLIKMFWDKWGKDILASFKAVFEDVKKIFSGVIDVIKGIANFIKSVFSGDWKGAWEAIKEVFVGVWKIISGVFESIWEGTKLAILIGLEFIQGIWNKIWTGIKDFFVGIWEGIVNGITNFVEKIKTTISNVVTTIKDGIGEAIDWIKELPEKAIQWGKDMIQGLIDGIKAMVGKIGDAVKGVAEKITSFLHFSVPDEGPLTKYESWMPDFMEGLAEGISSSEGKVLDKVKGLASGIQMLMSGATAKVGTASASTISNRTSSIVQNVDISNSYTGGSMDTQRNVSKAMKKSAVDATTQMARALNYARG